MRLSEAILLGLPEIKFTNNRWLQRTRLDSERCEGCLLGAALFAMGNRDEFNTGERMMEHYWPWTKSVSVPDCPLGCRYKGSHLTELFTHMADHYSWKQLTAEQISDFIRALEPSDSEVTNASEATGLPLVEQPSK